jgi:penicillin V acylase-like amidase (Ntn superfamily)
MYDISTIIPDKINMCSSIIAKNKEGKIIHGRNLDFWPWTIFSRDTAIV